MKSLIRGDCKKCGKCCSFHLNMHCSQLPLMDIPNRITDGVKMRRINNDWILLIWDDIKCRHLTDEGLCDIHNHKPKHCKDFPFNWSAEDFAKVRDKDCGYYVVDEEDKI